MDQSVFVGLITGTTSVSQNDLSLANKASIILFAQDVLKREMENLVTRSGFEPFDEFASARKGVRIAYNCAIPALMIGARIGLMFTTDTPITRREDGCSMEFLRCSAVLTTKCNLFWLAEKCVTILNESNKPVSIVVMDVDLVSLDFQNLRHYFERFPELFLKLLVNFRAVAGHALEMREQRQIRARRVFEKLDRMTRLVSLL
ncbi:MAG: hypothetical protein Q8P17_01090 [bacterium]|nr:hypothetical protein [bacterium]